jgi:predicted RNase H-like HicB family nuclease
MALIEEMPEVISQGDTLDEARANVLDALKLVLEANREEASSRQIAGAHVIREPISLPTA